MGRPVAQDVGGRLQIGAVVATLKDEFPEISISKIRFLEGEGLIAPLRAESGYRYFSEDDIERIRFVLRAQRDKFWPLRVIADALDAMDRGLTPTGEDDARPHVPRVPDDEDVPGRAELMPSREGLRLTRRELGEAAGVGERELTALTTYGLVTADTEGYFSADAVLVARAAARLAEHGLEPRHLRPFRLAADREISLLAQAGQAAGRGADRDAVRASILRECIALHVALVKTGLPQG